MPGHTKCCACHAKSSSQNWRSDAPKCNSSQEISARASGYLWWTCLLYCACHAKCIFADPLRMSHTCRRFWNCYKTLTFCSLLTRCTIPCACPRKTTSEHLKVLRTPQFFALLTSKCASRHYGVHLFISHPARWLRTRRFSEPTFRPSGATNHWKNTANRDFPTFSRTWIFFLLTTSSLSFFLLLFSSLTLPISAFHLSILSEVWLRNFLRIYSYTSSTAQGGGGSFKNRKPIGEIGCCESGMAEQIHWWTERCLRSPLFLSLSLTIYLPTYLSSMYLSIYRSTSLSLSSNYLSIYLSVCLSIYLSLSLSLSSVYLSSCLPVYLSIYLSVYLSICLSVYLSICLSVYLSICAAVSFSVM